MNIEQAINIIFDGLVSENSIPVKLRAYRELDLKQLDQVREALDFALEYYKGRTYVSKKIAMAMIDIQGAFFFRKGDFDDIVLVKLEDIGIELQERAIELFSE